MNVCHVDKNSPPAVKREIRAITRRNHRRHTHTERLRLLPYIKPHWFLTHHHFHTQKRVSAES